MQCPVAAVQGLTKNPKTFEEKMAEQGLQVRVAVFKERSISQESMKDQADFMLYGNWHRRVGLSILAAIATVVASLIILIRSAPEDSLSTQPVVYTPICIFGHETKLTASQ